jgi:tRNA G26 N,N-dimethylase Trm1
MIDSVVIWVEGIMTFLDKEVGTLDKNKIMTLFKKMAAQLEKFNLQKEGKAEDLINMIKVEQMNNMFYAVSSLCKFKVQEVETIARQIGGFDYNKVEVIIKFMKRFKL